MGGRGRGRGYGYRSNRPPRTGPRDNWEGPNGRSEETASGGGTVLCIAYILLI